MAKQSKVVLKALQGIQQALTKSQKKVLAEPVGAAPSAEYQVIGMRVRALLQLQKSNPLVDQLKSEGIVGATAMSDHLLMLYCSGALYEIEEPEPEPVLRSRFDRFEDGDGK